MLNLKAHCKLNKAHKLFHIVLVYMLPIGINTITNLLIENIP